MWIGGMPHVNGDDLEVQLLSPLQTAVAELDQSVRRDEVPEPK